MSVLWVDYGVDQVREMMVDLRGEDVTTEGGSVLICKAVSSWFGPDAIIQHVPFILDDGIEEGEGTKERYRLS